MTARRRPVKLEYGRLDYSTRTKLWTVIGYGPRVAKVGSYPTLSKAADALQAFVVKHRGQKGYGRPI